MADRRPASCPTGGETGGLPFPELRAGNLGVRIAASAAEIDAAQALRYRVFYQEMGARADAATATSQRDHDAFDLVADHLLVVDHALGAGAEGVVGTYRLIQREAAAKLGRFYSADEYDITPIMHFPGRILELGRSCVHAEYRSRIGDAIAVARHRGLRVPPPDRSDVRLRQPAGHRSGRDGRRI